jgi:ribosomal protein S18 acetylase RimI-like enzyme
VRVVGLTLRPADSIDSDLCYSIHEQTMRGYVEAMFGAWDAALQRRMHEAWFASARAQMIELDGDVVGILDVEVPPDHTYVNRIEVLRRGSGIGTALIAELTARGPVQLHVFRVNTRARALYERLGFVASDEAEDRILMEHPGSANREFPSGCHPADGRGAS